MADAYSFDVDKEAMQGSYRAVFDAYLRIFARLGLEAIPVEAQSGAIGGDVNHEFMVPSAVGEDHFVSCASCGYAANVEAATRGTVTVADEGDDGADGLAGPMVEHHTPDRPGIDLVVEFFDDPSIGATDMLKCLAVVDDQGRPALVLVPGDREAHLPSGWRLFEEGDFEAHPTLVKGFIGPQGHGDGVRVVADLGVARPGSWITGANRKDHHVSGARLDRDFTVDEWGSFAEVVSGDPCPRVASRSS